MAFEIGEWVKRTGGKWHLVESVVEDRAVIRCGKQMRRVTARGELQVSPVMPLTRAIGQPQLCKAGCDQPEFVDTSPVPEDDPAVAQEDPV